MDFMTAIRERRSVRNYRPEAVKKETLLELIDAAVQAPSAMDEQPWHFTIVTDKALLARMSQSAKAWMLMDSAAGSHIDHTREMLRDPSFNIFYDAGALIVISAPRSLQWAVEDCTLAAENLMLVAHARKLGTCWIGFAQGWLDTPEGHAVIGLDQSMLPVAPIIVGVPGSLPAHAKRRKARVHWV